MRFDVPGLQPEAVSCAPLFTNHGLVLLYIARQPGGRERDIAAAVGITERSAQRIVGDLVASGYITRYRSGRRNVYDIVGETAITDPIARGTRVRDFVQLAGREPEQQRLPA
ncbi:MAG: helix-turn-helix transcriptional regulator [Candidatus Dormibacteria bacterium]